MTGPRWIAQAWHWADVFGPAPLRKFGPHLCMVDALLDAERCGVRDPLLTVAPGYYVPPAPVYESVGVYIDGVKVADVEAVEWG